MTMAARQMSATRDRSSDPMAKSWPFTITTTYRGLIDTSGPPSLIPGSREVYPSSSMLSVDTRSRMLASAQRFVVAPLSPFSLQKDLFITAFPFAERKATLRELRVPRRCPIVAPRHE